MHEMKHSLAVLIFVVVFAPIVTVSGAPGRPPDPPIRRLYWAQFPVLVFISANGTAQKEEAQTILAGFDEWVAASHGKVRYLRVTEASKAEITVQLEAGRYLSVQQHSVGETTVYSSRGVLKEAKIRLAEGAAVPEDLQATAAHEFGHALGIQGHSQDPDDLMFPVEINHFNALDQPLLGTVHTVTAHDLQMLQDCYPGLFSSSGKP